MKISKIALVYVAVCLALSAVLFCGEAEADYQYSLWLGSHYSDFNDQAKKVAEYRHIYNEAYPEMRFRISGTGDGYYIDFGGHYYDNKNIGVDFKGRWSDRFSFKVSYQEFRRQAMFGLLDNFNVREAVPDGAGGLKPGGKMMSHEALDSVLDYHTDRHDIESKFELLLTHKYDFKLIAAHRTTIKKGVEQQNSVSHCLSCHVTSRSAPVSQITNQINLGLEAKPGPVDLGYTFSYRKFESTADDVSFFYEEAKHPVNGTAGAEFNSRVLWSDSYQLVGIYPETEKIASQVKFKTSNDKRVLNGKFSYSKTTNDVSELDNVVLGGTVRFSTVVTPRLWLHANATVSKSMSNDAAVDFPAWREGMTGGGQDIFDFRRYSSLDRLYGKGSVKADYRANPKTKLSFLAGYEHTRRYDYPALNSETASNMYFGEVSIKYRKGLKYKLSADYRLELTDAPFTNYDGLFEARGRTVLTNLDGAPQVYYYQREDLKYGTVTTLPTMKHDIDLKGTYRANDKVSLNGGVGISFDENDDFEQITVEHSSFKPNVSISVMPDARWSLVGGYTYDHHKSTGPITVALFDG